MHARVPLDEGLATRINAVLRFEQGTIVVEQANVSEPDLSGAKKSGAIT
jgi:hypothetical protein